MKLKFLAILATLTAFTINAQDGRFKADDAPDGLVYEWYEVGKSVQTAAAKTFHIENIPESWAPDYDNYVLVGENDPESNSLAGPNAYKNISVVPNVIIYNGEPYPVVAIGEYSFAGSYYNITLSDNVQYIGEGAFFKTEIQSFNSSNIKTIGDFAFSNNNSLKSVELGKNLSYLGKSAFMGCGSLITLKFDPESILETIGESAFENCTNLGSDYGLIEIPKSVKTIEKAAFKKCSSMKSLAFNEGLETICESAFEGCSGINTTAEKPIKFPDSLISIEEAAFKDCKSAQNIVFGKNLQEIGDYAFYRVDIVWSPFYLPSTITKIGYDAINFTNTNSSFTDIFYPNSTPNDIDEEAFGRLGGEDVKFNDDYWIYLTVCLHVPMGTRELYENCTGWRNFRCIIDDLIPEKKPESDPTSHTDGDDPLTYIIGYAYIKPGDKLNINKDVLKLEEGTKTQLKWKRIEKGTKPSENQGDNSQSGNQQNGQDLKESEEVIYEENPVVTMDSNGNVTAEKFGAKIVIAYRDGNYKEDGSGNRTQVEQTVAGAVILFVCPTITLVYDTKNETAQPGASQSLSRIRTLAEGDGTTENEITPLVNEATEVEQLKEDNATYEHLVVYESFPKLMLEPASGITISDIQRAKIDQNNNYTADGALADIDKEEQLQTDGLVEDAQYIVPINPVKENRVITFSGTTNDDQLTTEVEDEVIQLTPEIKVVVNGLTISIEGAQPESVVTVTNTNGQVVYNAKGKTFTMTTKGVYIVRVEDVTFKALVK